MTAERNVCQDLTLEALHRAVPPETIPAVLLQTETQVPRVRALTAQLPIGVLIAMNLSTPRALGHVLRKVAYGLRFSWPDPPYRVPGASAFVYWGSTAAHRRWWRWMSISLTLASRHTRPGPSAAGCA
jgi:hypothetical protein